MPAMSAGKGRNRSTRPKRYIKAPASESYLRIDRIVSAAEIADKSVFASFVANLLDSELLREDDEGLLRFDEHLLGPLAYAELVLPADARQAIRRIAVHQSQ